MNSPTSRMIVRIMSLVPLLSFSGCTTVVRENIISNINTGVGVSVTENPQTQLYEIKAGYIRTQFYSVPTGKMILYSDKSQIQTTVVYNADGKTTNQVIVGGIRIDPMTKNAANLTPEVVSGIKMHSGIDNLIVGMDVSENFAVGKTAVMSPAAVAMYTSQSQNPQTAQAAADAAAAVSNPEAAKAQVATKFTLIDRIVKYVDPNNTGKVDGNKLEDLTKGTHLGKDWIDQFAGKDTGTLRSDLQGPDFVYIPALARNLPPQ